LVLISSAAIFALGAQAQAQQAAPEAKAQAATASGLQSGPATIGPHWSKYQYPTSVPEGAAYYVIEKGDTLWDLSRRFLNSPYLWPQIWDQNKYIRDAHWIYPGDPLLLPEVALVARKAGEAGVPGEPGLGEAEEEAGPLPPGLPKGARVGPGGDILYPAIEEMALLCAHYILPSPEDMDLHVIGSEHGATKLAFAERDILYLNKGSNGGLKPGDAFTLHHLSNDVKHPVSTKKIGTVIETTGVIRVLLVEESAATAVVERACGDVHEGDYALPAAAPSVPLIIRRPPPDRLTPPTGKARGYVVAIAEDSMIAGENHLLSVDLGSADGLTPGSTLAVFKVMYPTVPTSRNVLGEIAVVSTRERTATARVIHSADAIMPGDQVELR
jgi:hypothetical protein